MKGTVKKIVSVLLALAMVVTGLSYTPKDVKAADYTTLTYTNLGNNTNTELSTSLYGSQYAVYSGEITVGVAQYQSTNYSELYFAFSNGVSASNFTVTVNGDSVTTEGTGIRIYNAAAYLTYEYNVISGSSDSGSFTIIVYCPGNSGNGTYDETETGEPEADTTAEETTEEAVETTAETATGETTTEDSEVENTVTWTERWEAYRKETATWTAVDGATGYAIYVNGKLVDTVGSDTLTYDIYAYVFAKTSGNKNINDQATTVGTHTVSIVALMDEETVAKNSLSDVDYDYVMDTHTTTLYVNYIFGNGTDTWNTSGTDSVWNFTVCESAEGSDIEEGASINVTYNADGSVTLTDINTGQHSTYLDEENEGDQEWTIKAAIYDEYIETGDTLNLSFDITGDSSLIGQTIAIKCIADEMMADGVTYAGDSYGEDYYTFISDGEGGAYIHYSITVESTNDTYDLLFGLGMLNTTTLTLSDVTETKVYGVTGVTGSAVYTTEHTGTNETTSEATYGILVNYTTDVPLRLSDEYTYNVYIGNKNGASYNESTGARTGTWVESKEVSSGEILDGYTVGEYYIIVESIYDETVTAWAAGEVNVEDTSGPDLVIGSITVKDKDGNAGANAEFHVGDTVTIEYTVENIGNGDMARTSEDSGNVCAFLYTVNASGEYVYKAYDINIAAGNSGTIQAGGSITGSFTYTIDENDSVGDNLYHIAVKADGDGIISELNENNNYTQVTILAYPAIEEVTLTNDGTNITAKWPKNSDETITSYTIEYTTSGGETKTETVNGETTYIFPDSEYLQNNSTVTVYATTSDGSTVTYAKGTALADLVMKEFYVTDGELNVGETESFTGVIVNQGTAVATSADAYLTLTLVCEKGFGNGTSGNTYNYTLKHITTVAPNATESVEVGGFIAESEGYYTITYKIDDASRITESNDYSLGTNNNEGTYTFTATSSGASEQQKMDWTRLYDATNSSADYTFTVGNGSQSGHIEYKILDTSNTEIDYENIITTYSGYNSSYMSIGVTDNLTMFSYTYDGSVAQYSSTKVYFKQVTSDYCNSYTTDSFDDSILMAAQNIVVADESGNTLKEANASSEIVYNGNGFNFYVNGFAMGKYYVMYIYNDETGNYLTVAFRVTGETGDWIQVGASDSTNADALPAYYHEAACKTTARYYYNASDLNMSAISTYNGGYLTVGTDTSMTIQSEYKVLFGYASVNEEGTFVVPELDTLDDVTGYMYNTEGNNTIQIRISDLMVKYPVHSANGGQTDDEYYYMVIYPDETDENLYICIPIRVNADIPMVENVESVNAGIQLDGTDKYALSVSFVETANQAAYDYHYNVYVYTSESNYQSGNDAIEILENVDPSTAEVIDVSNYITDDTTTLYVVVESTWCDQAITTAVTAAVTVDTGWREISGESGINVHAGQNTKVEIVGTVSFYKDVTENHAYDVTGYNGYYINVSGNTSWYNSDTEVKISEGVNSENELSSVTEYTDVTTYEKTDGQIKINTANEFQVTHQTTYYNLKISNSGEDDVIIMIKVEVTPGDIEVNAFQINTDTSSGGAAEYNPAIRIVSNVSKIVATGEDDNPTISSVVKYGTIYTANEDASASSMTFSSENLNTIDNETSTGEISDGIYAFEATSKGTLENWSYATDENAIYYAMTIKSVTYNIDMLSDTYSYRAYAIAEDGTVIYSDSVESTNIYDVAKVLYDNSLMTTEMAHDFLYSNILNIVAIKNNRGYIANAMLEALVITSSSDDNYKYVNNAYKDMLYYVNMWNPYTGSYYERGDFTCKTKTDEENTEEKLIEILNTATSTSYSSVAEWCYDKVDSYYNGYGFYKKVEYNHTSTTVTADEKE